MKRVYGVGLAVALVALGAVMAWEAARAQDINQIGRYEVTGVTIDLPGKRGYSTALKVDTTSGQAWRWDKGGWVDMGY